jgi:quercetin dioxygenase-like cupin family protein
MPTFHQPYDKAIEQQLDFPGQITLRVLIPGSVTGGTLAVFEDIVQPDIGPPRHIHPEQDETFLVEDGQFAFEIDGTRVEAGPGDVAFVPRGTVHAFRNIGTGAGRLRYVFSPALQAEEMFRAFHTAAAGGAPSAQDMQRIALRYGQTFVGPPLEK